MLSDPAMCPAANWPADGHRRCGHPPDGRADPHGIEAIGRTAGRPRTTGPARLIGAIAA